MALLEFWGVLLGVDHALLGLTVLAWGNSLGDLSTNLAMTRCGLSPIAGGYSAPQPSGPRPASSALDTAPLQIRLTTHQIPHVQQVQLRPRQ